MKGAEKLPFSTQQAEEGVKKLKNEIDRLKSEETPQRAEQFKKNFERWSGVKLDHAVSTLRGVDLAPEKGAAPEEEGPPPERDPTIYDL
jgi:Sec-independent protein translocase protein TatA